VHDRDADGNGVFDEVTLGARTTTRVSVATSGAQGNGASATDGEPLLTGVAADGQLDLSPDGLWVAFRSEASNLVLGDTNGVADIFLYGLTGGQTTRVSVAADGTGADGPSQSPGVSAGGQRVVFASGATNLVAGDANGLRDVFLVDRPSGQVVRLSETPARGDADGASDTPSIDDAGQVVAFATRATNVVPMLASSTTSQIVIATIPSVSSSPVIAGSNFVSESLINLTDILKQLASGALPPGSATVQPGNGASTQPEVCGNGKCVGYATDASNLTPNDPDTNGVRDTVTQSVVTSPPPVPPVLLRVSKDAAGNEATEATSSMAVSADGGVVAMESEADLTPQVAASNPTGVNVFVRAAPLAVGSISRTFAYAHEPSPVTVAGTGFQAGARVLFGTTAGGTTAATGTHLTVQTPTGVAAGVVPILVKNPDGSSQTLWQGFTFLAPPGQAPSADADNDGLLRVQPQWAEAHNSFGATATGTVWALGSGEVTAAPAWAQTYVLLANTASHPARVTVTLLYDDGTAAVTREFGVNATSRFNVDVRAEFPEATGKRFGARIESLAANGNPAAQIVVEQARYHNDATGVVWAAGSNALATRIR
jgi:hypothetical protein